MKQEEVLIRNGYDVGIGVAMATGSPMALGAVGAVTPPEIGGGGSGTFTFHRIESNDSLATELGIGASLSGGIGLFSASASFSFTQKCKIQSSSLAVLISAEERFAFRQMDSPALSPAAAALVATGNMELFAERFGEYFVRGVATGGRFIGVVRIDTRSSESKTDVDSALSGHYGLALEGEAKVHISNALASANARIEAFVLNDGGRVTIRPKSSDPIELMRQMYAAMDEWTATVRTEPMAYSVTLAPYVIALGPNPPNAADLEHQRDVLIRCAKLRAQTMDRLNLVEYILDPLHSGEFAIIDPPNGPNLPALQAALATDLEVIGDAASFAIDNPKDAHEPEAFLREVKGIAGFTLTALPTNMPKHTDGKSVVPNFVGLKADEALQLSKDTHVAVNNVFPTVVVDFGLFEAPLPDVNGRVISQDVPPEAQISPPLQVTLTFGPS